MIGFLLPDTAQCQHPEDSDTFRHAGFVAVGGSFCGEGGGGECLHPVSWKFPQLCL